MKEDTKLKDPKPIRFVSRGKDAVKLLPVSGAMGGPTPSGDFVCYFYMEHSEILAEVEQEVKDGQLLQPKLDPNAQPTMIRDFQVAIALNMNNAEGIAKWILSSIAQLQTAIGQQQSDKKSRPQYYT
jgi:hypothetical protein